ncbi:zinc finger MYND domain-containing protein 11 isoform X2 [Halyomorpha halys]|uniref:zinc finger MYND domain-containing protein 11 isoform X2 n=1 Tax=Halyomorpha halys TaxID=286706 RepID=UPI0006D4F49A|nr:zinc finger MYND domain-containing protein 11 isoform X2 [Halyomorpha halys]
MNKVLLKSMYRRRMSCPQVVQQLWDAVKVIRCQHQVPTLEKIAKYMTRVHAVTEEEVSRQLQYCVRDGLLLVRKSKGSKGSKGVEQEGYKLPEIENDNNSKSHDWYCFECHTGGDVIPCQGCHRAYHMSCITNTLGTQDKFICTVCQSCDEDSSLSNVKLSKLNRLLTMVCTTLKDRYSSLVNSSEFLRRSIMIGSPGAQMDIGGAKESWRVSYLVYRPVDLGTMMAAAKSQKYPNVAAFLAQAQSIVHSVVIFHGVLSDLADKSRQMLRECLSEIAKIRACHSCYEAAVLRGRHWFCKPCRPPHQLVFAGSPYMPAKVLQEKDDKLEVVYFGPQHPRATVERESTLPITTPVGHLGKTSPTWSKAMDELARHQKMLTFPNQSSDSDDSDVEEDISKEKISLVKETLPVVKSPASLKRERYSSDEENIKKEEPKKEVAVKKKRGRPPKNSLTPVSASSTPSTTPVSTEPKRKPGRPRRKKPEEEVEEKSPLEKEIISEVASEALNDEEIKVENPRPESPTTTAPTTTKNEEEIVSSSCMEPQVRSFGTQTVKKEKANKEIIAKLKEELDEVRTAHAEELKALKETHAQEVAATKKKQWCYNCEQEAIYHCCWNTAYCSTECQQVHWQREHKRVCRRKR